MTRLKHLLIVGSVLPLLMASSAFAQANNQGGKGGHGGGAQAEVVNGQVNLGNVWSTLNANIFDAQGHVDVAATSVGNSVQIVTFADSIVTNDQSNMSTIGSEVYAHIGGVGGNVTVTSNAVCNDADVSTDPHLTKVSNHQYCGEGDPSAHIDADIGYVQGGVGVSANAIGNQLQVDSNAKNFPVTSTQVNAGAINSSVNVHINNIGGNTTATATAVGNTAQIIHY